MSSDQQTRDSADLGVRNCRREEAAYRSWLAFLGPLRWRCLGGGVVFSAAAGLSILGESALLGQKWKLWSALLAFTGSALTGVHGVLRCDAYQAECHRLIQEFKSLGFQYEAAVDLEPETRAARTEQLHAEFARLVKGASATPTRRCYATADQEAKLAS